MPTYFEIADQLANGEFEAGGPVKTPRGGLVWVIKPEQTLEVGGVRIRFVNRAKIVFKNGPVDFKVFNPDGTEVTKRGN